jgi:hypothetical protein
LGKRVGSLVQKHAPLLINISSSYYYFFVYYFFLSREILHTEKHQLLGNKLKGARSTRETVKGLDRETSKQRGSISSPLSIGEISLFCKYKYLAYRKRHCVPGVEMEKKRIGDDLEQGPTPSPRPVDRFGFIKQEQSSSPEGITKSRSTHERDRYEFLW